MSQLAKFWFVMMSEIRVVLGVFCPFVDFRPSASPGTVGLSPIRPTIRDMLCSVHGVVNSGIVVSGRSRNTRASALAYTWGKGSPMVQGLENLEGFDSIVIQSIALVHRPPAAGLLKRG